jgi:hypothetical protein
MTALGWVVLGAAAVALVAGFTLAWPPLGLIAVAVVLFAAWFFLVDDVGGEQ